MQNRRLNQLPWILILAACSKDAPPAPPPLPTGVSHASGSTAPAAAPSDVAGRFEGELSLLVTPAARRARGQSGAQQPWAVTLQIKHAKLRVDLPDAMAPAGLAGGIHVVMDAPAKKLFAVVDGKKQVVTVPLENLGNQLKSLKPQGRPSGADEKPAAQPRITMTGHHDTVAGRDCEDWDIANPRGDKLRVCVANEGAAWFELPTLGLPLEHGWARALLDGKHLPLRAIALDESGAENGRIEVTKIEDKPIADAAFAMPLGYQVVDVATMMQQMMAGAIGGAARESVPTEPGAEGASPKLRPDVQAMLKQMQERAKKQARITSKSP